jgi:hypothetical protein
MSRAGGDSVGARCLAPTPSKAMCTPDQQAGSAAFGVARCLLWLSAARRARSSAGEHKKFKRPLQARQALGKPDTTAWSGPCAPIHSLKRHLEPRPDTSRAASHARAPRFTRGLRPSAGTATLVARSAVPAAGRARQPRHAFGGCGARSAGLSAPRPDPPRAPDPWAAAADPVRDGQGSSQSPAAPGWPR